MFAQYATASRVSGKESRAYCRRARPRAAISAPLFHHLRCRRRLPPIKDALRADAMFDVCYAKSAI